MAWRAIRAGNGTDFEPDGFPFDPPLDSFERKYNEALVKYGKKGVEYTDIHEGFPIPIGTMERDPETSGQTRRLLDWFFSPMTQTVALRNGNLHSELDAIAKDLLRWAVHYRVPLTDPERNVATRLGLDTQANPKLSESPSKYHSLGF